jgi:hypothetical protein
VPSLSPSSTQGFLDPRVSPIIPMCLLSSENIEIVVLIPLLHTSTWARGERFSKIIASSKNYVKKRLSRACPVKTKKLPIIPC